MTEEEYEEHFGDLKIYGEFWQLKTKIEKFVDAQKLEHISFRTIQSESHPHGFTEGKITLVFKKKRGKK